LNVKGSKHLRYFKNTLRCGLNIINACLASENPKTSKMDILLNQIFDSLIVGGIVGISTYVSGGEHVSVGSAVFGFLLTFLIKMKEYRKID
jgi:hypothetical protein